VSEQTLHARGTFGSGRTGILSLRAGQARIGRLAYRWRWPLGAVALLVVSALIVLWARVRPGYDPYGWLVWGHLTLHGKLDTNGAPSWKPLPYLFTLPYALIGRHAVYLWMTTAFAISLSGVVFAWRVAFALVAAPGERRYAAYAAGLTAAVAVLAIQDFPHAVLSAESDTMVVALCLAAVDGILQRRYRWAFWAWWLAALGRPEVWAPLGLYLLWAWRAQPRMRLQMTGGVILIPLLWFGIPALTSHSPFSAATLAEKSPRQLHGNKITGTISRFLALNSTVVKLAAGLAVVLAVVRRDRAVLLLTGGVVLWVVVEAAFALHGWSAVSRYLYEAAAGVGVLAGVAVGRVILELPDAARRLWPGPRAATAGGAAALVLVAAFAVSLVPVVHSRIVAEGKDLRGQRTRTRYIDLLASGIAHLGGGRILACGQPQIGIGWQSILAWQLGTNVGVLYFSRRHEIAHPHPIENMYPHSYGWHFFPSDWTNSTQASRCRGLTYRT
jgi:hypothetical protein